MFTKGHSDHSFTHSFNKHAFYSAALGTQSLELTSFIHLKIYVEHLLCVSPWGREVNKAGKVLAVLELSFGMGA